MPKYTVTYTLSYGIEADNEERAIDIASWQMASGDEGFWTVELED